jgi:hypothetical protein
LSSSAYTPRSQASVGHGGGCEGGVRGSFGGVKAMMYAAQERRVQVSATMERTRIVG